MIIPYINRGEAYIAQKEYDKAIEDCTKAIELKPDFSMNPTTCQFKFPYLLTNIFIVTSVQDNLQTALVAKKVEKFSWEQGLSTPKLSDAEIKQEAVPT